jgi:hypothetical protein
MEILRNWGTEFVHFGYIKRTSIDNTESSSICLHSVVLVSVHYWLCWVTVSVKESENESVPFWKRTDRCVFSYSICDKTATLLAVPRVTVSKVMSACTHSEKTNIRNSGWKSTKIERDYHTLRTVSKNHRTTAAQVTAELDICLEDCSYKKCSMWDSQI